MSNNIDKRTNERQRATIYNDDHDMKFNIITGKRNNIYKKNFKINNKFGKKSSIYLLSLYLKKRAAHCTFEYIY